MHSGADRRDAGGSQGTHPFTDGACESAQDWRNLLLDLKRRGLDARTELAIADGAFGFWKAAGEVWPTTRDSSRPGRCGTAELFAAQFHRMRTAWLRPLKSGVSEQANSL